MQARRHFSTYTQMEANKGKVKLLMQKEVVVVDIIENILLYQCKKINFLNERSDIP